MAIVNGAHRQGGDMVDFEMSVRRDLGLSGSMHGGMQYVLDLTPGNLWLHSQKVNFFCLYGDASNGMLGSMLLFLKRCNQANP